MILLSGSAADSKAPDNRIPRFQRDVLPVFECGGAVAAVAGLGPDRAFTPQSGQGAWHISVTQIKS
mgnify:CR=1 FL=1